MIIRLIFVGLVAGSIFGGLLKIIEILTHKKVYVLLLNIDYFPVLKDFELSEGLEFSLHLIVSMLVVFVLYALFRRFGVHQKVSLYVYANIVIGGVLYVTTSFSERTPALLDVTAFIYWIVGHAIFGFLVGITVKKT